MPKKPRSLVNKIFTGLKRWDSSKPIADSYYLGSQRKAFHKLSRKKALAKGKSERKIL